MVVAAAPLRPALEALFTGPTKEEEAKGLSSSTFGMRFEGVTLTNGVALVKFSQPANETNYGSLGPAIFAEAIEKTARQFPTVKKVEICAVGETLIDSQLEKPFPKCAK
jgi:spore germination protein GerM